MNRKSRIAHHLARRSTSTGTREVPAGPWADALARDSGFLLRLSWRSGPRVPTDWGEIAAGLSAERDLAVFCDTSAFDDTSPQALWDVLLDEPGRLALTERVTVELRPWLDKRPDHPVARALREHHPGVTERREPRQGEPGRRVFDYYVALLSVRRRATELARSDFRREHGRDPEAAEERLLAEDVQRRFGERGRLIATKPAGFQTDETLVYLAIEHALSTGKQTLILTRDADVEEKFYKLIWLIDTHYRGMLLADDYVDRFGAHRTHPMPDALLNDPDGPFEPHDAVLVERDLDLRGVLPPEPHFVAVSCLNAGVYASHLCFGAETEMARLLEIKDATGGLSTDRLGGRNLHASIVPFESGGRPCAAVVYDRRWPVGDCGANVAKLDVLQALLPCEQHADLVPDSAPHDQGGLYPETF